MKLYSPKAIANYFLELASKNGQTITPIKLQKLVYYAAGWFAGYTGKPLIDEAIEAWQYGPILPSLYRAFRSFGTGPITTTASHINDEFGPVDSSPPQDADIRRFLEKIWESYGKFTGLALSEMAHRSGSPWDRTWSTAQGVKNVSIPFELIRDHFKTAIENIRLKKAA